VSLLFTPGRIGTLEVPNRMVRSATAERLADEIGRPRPQLKRLYETLVQGGVGLIITGHLYVHSSGKAHPEMMGIYDDQLIPGLAELTAAVHRHGGRIVAQINHGGMQCSREAVPETVAPSAVNDSFLEQPAREMRPDEIVEAVRAYAEAARRAKAAGFDGIQLHGAHGYLISQFLSPYINRRRDEWGGDPQRRMSFLRQVCQAVRNEVGRDYPVLIKLGMMDGVAGGLTLQEGLQIAAALAEMAVAGVETSGGVQASSVHPNPKEPYFRPLARSAREATRLPIILVGGIRSRQQMEDVLLSGDADFVSLSRPLICEPDLPNRLRLGLQEHARCISGNRCWPKVTAEGITCKCLETDKR
jgi:2,4-dienoyl-CoA reductase-like NADH-dependent reductase (Old Yellow Enzyme family)